MTWLRRWGLGYSPFDAPDAPIVAVPTQAAAIDRIVHAIDRRCRNVVLFGAPGLGKTTVLRQALARASGPGRKVVLVRAPARPEALLEMFAERLNGALGPFSNPRADGWRALERALRVEALHGTRAVLAIDDWDEGLHDRALRELDALAHHFLGPLGGPTIVRAGRCANGDDELHTGGNGGPAIVLRHWTRSEVDVYLRARWAAARRSDAGPCNDGPIEGPFTPRAITRIHGLARGAPRSVERLATLGLIAAAESGLDVVSSDLIDAIFENVVEALVEFAT